MAPFSLCLVSEMIGLLEHYESIPSLARALRQGELTVEELVNSCLERIQSLEPRLGAFRVICREAAVRQARAAQESLAAGRDLGPLHGIPLAVKDLFDVAGMVTSAGSRLLEGNLARRHAGVVRRCLQAGMVLVGKTNTVQFAYGGVGINRDHGTPRNPWCTEHYVPGGSSSGSAVAVASGMVPAALGTDTGGSVRIPAALCGITALKTTVGRVSRAGVYPLSWTLDSVGPLARNVEDVAILYEMMAGPDPEDQSTWRQPPVKLRPGSEPNLKGVRLFFPRAEFWEDLDPELEKAVTQCGEVLRSLGANLDEMEFPEAREACQIAKKGLIIASEAYCANRHWVEEHFQELDPVVAFRIVKGKEIPAHEYIRTLREVGELRLRALETLQHADALLVPTTRIPALPVRDLEGSIEAYASANWGYLRNTSIGNVLDLCGLSVPCGFTSMGLPMGLMIYGKPFEEEMILRIGMAFQKVTQWHRMRPRCCAAHLQGKGSEA
jgi:aspartyl-tRNA(Asn)/glutamyl-tRNA(Gln) amidotransferase subunit A